jgi:hypothetical protein
MALRFVSTSAQDGFIPLCYALHSKGERRGEQRRGLPRGVLLQLEQAKLLFSQLEEDR